MKLKELQLRNWMLFREADLSFAHTGNVIGIVGHYVDEDARSNRSGKSTVTEAIKYLLYGKGRGQGSKLINRSSQQDGEDMAVRGILQLRDGREVEVTRGRTHDNKGFLEISEMEGAKISEGDEYLTELIGFDDQEYESTCFFSQGDIHRFMLARPGEKRDLIQRWLRQDRWTHRLAFADGRSKALRSESEALRMALSSIPEVGKSTAQLKKDVAGAERRHGKAKERLDVALSAWETARDSLSELEKARDTHDQVDALERRLRVATEKLAIARKKSKVRQKAKARWDRVGDRLAVMVEELAEGSEERRTKISLEFREQQLIERRLGKVHEVSGVCPVLGEQCSRVGPEAVEPLEKELNRIKHYLVQLGEELAEFRNERVTATAVTAKELRKHTKEIERNEYAPPSMFKEIIEELTTEIEEAYAGTGGHQREELPDLIQRAEKEISAQRDRIGRARELESDALQLATQAQSELKQAMQATTRRKELTDKLADVERDRTAWDYVKYMFSSRGIAGAIMEASFGKLEENINFILDRMNTDLSVRFQPYRETRQWEKTCLACGAEFEKTRQNKCESCGETRQRKRVDQLILNVIDEYEGQISEFGLDSGAGKTLLSFAVRLALMFLKIRESAGDIPIVVMDEVLADLDEINRAAVLDLVQNVLVQRYGVQQVFVISHNADVQNSIEDVLVVTRHHAHSTVGWA